MHGQRARTVSLVLLVAAVCSVLLLSSCQWTKLGLKTACESVGAAATFPFSGPFSSADPILFTKAKAATALMNYRICPATAVTGRRELSLADCRSLALTNNLELHAARFEELTKKAIEYTTRTKMLPHLSATGNLSQRDNPPFSYSDVMGAEGEQPIPGGGGAGVNTWSTGHERSSWHLTLETSWSPTDAALAYYMARSNKNDRLAAHLQRVRTAQKLIGNVDTAFQRLLVLQQCLPMARRLVELRRTEAHDLDELLKAKLKTVQDGELSRQNLVKARSMLALIESELGIQKNTLASAMAISPDECTDLGFKVIGTLKTPRMDRCISEMELTAVHHRPEAYQAGLNNLNSLNDMKKATVKAFPKLTGFWRYNYDKDKYLYNKDWKEIGATVYFDILDFMASSGERLAARATYERTDREIAAITLGIVAQVRTSAVKWRYAVEQVQIAETSVAEARKILHTAELTYSANAVGKLSVEDARAGLVAEEIALLRAIGEANASLADLEAAMGTNYGEPLPHL